MRLITSQATIGRILDGRWCNYDVSHLERASKLGPVTSLQPRYSLLNRQIETEGHMDWCRENNCGIVSYSPMESGLLTNKTNAEWIDALPDTDWRRHKPDHPVAANIHPPRREPFLKFLAALDSIAAESDHTIGQLAIAWTLRRPEVTSAIVGARRPGGRRATGRAARPPFAASSCASRAASRTPSSGACAARPTSRAGVRRAQGAFQREVHGPSQDFAESIFTHCS